MNAGLNPLLAQQFTAMQNSNTNGLWPQTPQPMPQFNNNFLPHYEVIQVSGENGAEAFQMGPNSSVLLADSTAPVIWLVKTDGAGYKTKTAYSIAFRPQEKAPDYNQLEQRISRLEELYAAKSQSNSKQSRKQSAASHAAAESSVDAAS